MLGWFLIALLSTSEMLFILRGYYTINFITLKCVQVNIIKTSFYKPRLNALKYCFILDANFLASSLPLCFSPTTRYLLPGLRSL